LGQVAYGNGSAYQFTSGGSERLRFKFQTLVVLPLGFLLPAWGTNYWTQINNTLFPNNYWSDDLLIGGNSTASAKFQIFADTGSASMSGTLTYLHHPSPHWSLVTPIQKW